MTDGIIWTSPMVQMPIHFCTRELLTTWVVTMIDWCTYIMYICIFGFVIDIIYNKPLNNFFCNSMIVLLLSLFSRSESDPPLHFHSQSLIRMTGFMLYGKWRMENEMAK
jgi:hypothetical protein